MKRGRQTQGQERAIGRQALSTRQQTETHNNIDERNADFEISSISCKYDFWWEMLSIVQPLMNCVDET